RRTMDRLTRVIVSTDTATSASYTLSLHDALPILAAGALAESHQHAALLRHQADRQAGPVPVAGDRALQRRQNLLRMDLADVGQGDRKSTRLNSSHVKISYAVFCVKKKK